MSRWCPEYAPTCPACNIEKLKERTSRRCQKCSRHPGWHLRNLNKNVLNLRISNDDGRATALDTLADDLLSTLRKSPQSLESLATMLKVTPGQALDALIALREKGVNLHSLDGKWSLEKTPAPNVLAFEYISRPDNTFVFGCVSDTHLCSKYCREEVLSEIYDEFRTAGVDRAFHGGNWIEGENENNKFDVTVHGLEPQVQYLVKNYPQRPGIVTYAVWGEDHEGFYARREAVNMGTFAANAMKDAERTDWVNLGFMEACVQLVNVNTGARTKLVVMHPGGGSAYALSWRPQKIVESLQGGQKPAVLLIAHYHKLSYNIIRNVHVLQIGSTKDQDPFMRKKGIDSQVGAMIVTLRQDPKTGAIRRCLPDTMEWFDRDYENDRWSHSGPVVQPEKVGIGA